MSWPLGRLQRRGIPWPILPGDPVAVLTVPRAAAKLCRAAQTITVTGTHDPAWRDGCNCRLSTRGLRWRRNASQTQTESATNGHIAFERLRFQNSPLWGELFVMNADGTGVRKLTLPPNGTEDTNPDWSPDGSRLVFERAPSTGAHSIWTVNSDGTGLRRLTPDCPPGAGVPTCRADDGWPVWSPDGKHIAFQRLTGALRPNGATVNDAKAIYKDELTIMDADGGHTRTLFLAGAVAG